MDSSSECPTDPMAFVALCSSKACQSLLHRYPLGNIHLPTPSSSIFFPIRISNYTHPTFLSLSGIPSSCFPAATGLGASWDTELLHRVGKAIGVESKAKGSHIVLGPTINIQRSPLGGRGFESYSEDPYLSGTLARAFCEGLQQEGVAATIKHFVSLDIFSTFNSEYS